MADFNTKIKIFENKLGVFLKAVEISHESIAEIRSNIITAPRGLQQGGNSESSLIDNTINASAYGFYVQDTALIVANGNKLTGEEGDSIGLYLGGGAEANIKENSMLGFSGGCKVDGAASLSAGNNQVEAIKHGFEFAGNSSGSLEDNKISAENGIYQSGCSSMIGLRNNFSRVKHGVYLLDETKSEMIENILEGDSEDSLGFYCGGVSEAIFSSNILSNFTNGLRADSSANVIAKENKLTCTGDGFAFLGSTESQLETNQVKSLDGIALVYLMESGGQAFKNTLSGLTGIECSATTQLKAEENIIEFKDYGINARDKASLVLVGNSMKGKGTTSAGVFLGGFTQAKLEKNNIQAGRAFFASDNSATSAKENTFEGIEDALILSGASETILENNKILSEEGAGLLLSLEATGSLSENFIEAMGGIKSSGSAELDLNKNEIKTKKYAVHLSGNSLARLKENKLFGDYSLGICFEVGGNASISARGNTVKKFKEMVHSFENASLRLVSNHFEEIYEGMRFEGCAEGDLKENIIHCDNGDCLVFTDRSTGNLLANRIYSPGGVSLFGSSEVKVQENIFEVKDSALRLKGQSQGQVAKSKFLLSGAKSIAVTIGGLSGGVFNSNHIDAPEGAGFFISSEGECDLIKNEITSLNGLEASAMGNVRLKENRFYIKGCAVRMDQQSNLEATDNYIKGTSDTSSGFELTGISRSEITSNTLEELMVGLKLDTSAKVQLQKNNISCIATACEAGGTAEVALSENKIFCKRGISFVFRLEASGSLENNLINAPGVLDLSGSAEVKFRENVLSFRVFGVRGSGQSRGDFYLNKLTGNAENSVGFDLADAAEALITEDIIQNVHTALKTADSSQIKISSGRLDANHVAVSAKSVSQVVVEGCYVSSQDLSATLDDECSGLFMESLFFSPKSIKASGLSHLSFQENTVNVSEWGLVCSDQVTLSVKGNKIKGTGLENSVGIELSGMSEASIEECLVQNFTLNFKIVEEARAGLKANEILDGVIGIKIEDLSEVSAISNKILRNQVGIKYNSLISSLTSRDNEMADNAVNIYDSCLESVDPEIDSQGWSFQKKLRERVIVSSRLFPLKIVYSLYYKIALFIIGAAGLFFLNSRFYVRRGLLLKDWIPGMSDIDLFMLIKKRTPSKEKKFVKFSSGFFRIFKKLFPILGEIHSGTWEELELFMKHGGVRAWEASDRWRPLLHSRSLPKLKEASSRQFRLSCASEILNSLQQMSKNIYWDMEALSSIQVMKATADILKYKMYLEGEKNRFNSRKEVFDAALLNLELSKTLSLLIEKISLAWVDRNPCFIPLEKLFYQLLLLVTPGIISLNKELFLEPVTDYRIIEYPGGRDRLGKMPEWKGLCIRLRSGAEKSVRKIVQENPGLFYIIIENNIKEEDYHKLIESSRKVKKESLLTATKIFLMTEAMYELMASTLHFEIPNNFAFSEIPGGYRIKEFSLYKRFEYELAKSGPSLFINSGSSEMLKEAVVKAAVSYRYSFYNDREMDAPFYILYKLNKPFELLIALEDHIFLSPPLIECMRDYYSEAVNQNENFDSLNDKIGDLSDEEISGFSPREIFFETYEEISDVVKNLLEILANSPL